MDGLDRGVVDSLGGWAFSNQNDSEKPTHPDYPLCKLGASILIVLMFEAGRLVSGLLELLVHLAGKS